MSRRCAPRGRIVDDALREQRITREDVFAALRADGGADLSNFAAAVLETDGSISVIGGEGQS